MNSITPPRRCTGVCCITSRRFLLGLTATPDRSDQSDILALCDDNLVFERNLFAGIDGGFLVPFHYFGILDESVDYREAPGATASSTRKCWSTSWPPAPAPAMR